MRGLATAAVQFADAFEQRANGVLEYHELLFQGIHVLDVGACRTAAEHAFLQPFELGFEGVDDDGTPLLDWLRQRGIDEVDIAGIATDYCVRCTAHDAAHAGLTTRVLVDLTAAVGADSAAVALAGMRTAGVTVVGGP